MSSSTPASCATCTHLDVMHAIRGNGSRGACSTSWGPTATPCGCKAYAAAEPAPELRRCCQQAELDGFSMREHKPWRVASPQLGSSDWHTQKEALDHADRRQSEGLWVTVRYWSEGRWEHYATFAPSTADEPQEDALFDLPAQPQRGGQHP